MTLHLLLLCKHANVDEKPAYEPWVKLDEMLKVKAAYPWIQLPANKEIVEAAFCVAALCSQHALPASQALCDDSPNLGILLHRPMSLQNGGCWFQFPAAFR